MPERDLSLYLSSHPKLFLHSTYCTLKLSCGVFTVLSMQNENVTKMWHLSSLVRPQPNEGDGRQCVCVLALLRMFHLHPACFVVHLRRLLCGDCIPQAPLCTVRSMSRKLKLGRHEGQSGHFCPSKTIPQEFGQWVNSSMGVPVYHIFTSSPECTLMFHRSLVLLL